MQVLEAVALTKRFDDVEAVRGVDLRIEPGETFGLLGPNGAGKSTTIHMLVGAIAPDSGRARLDAKPVTDPEVRRAIGIAPQDLAIYEELSAEENLAMFARVYGLRGSRLRERVRWGLELAGLVERRRDRAKTYSGGMKRRLNLACAAVHEPAVLICDEPTVGVDPQSRNHIFDSIEALSDAGATVLYTTHYMEEAERLCDRVAIMDHGQVLVTGEVDALIEEHGGKAVIEAKLRAPPEDAAGLPGVLEGETLRVESEDPLATVAALGKCDVEIARLRVDRPDLERVFLQLTGRRLRD